MPGKRYWGWVGLFWIVGIGCRALGLGASSETSAASRTPPTLQDAPTPIPSAPVPTSSPTPTVDTPSAAVTPSRSVPLLAGVYPRDYVAKAYIQRELDDLEAWAGKRLSLVGFFSDLEDPNPAYNLPVQLESIWARGSVPLVNLNIGTMGRPRTAWAVARGGLDGPAHRWFAALAAWLRRGEGRWLLLAPLPEANIRTGNTYGGDPEGYRAAYRHLQAVAAAQGVPREAVRWVFAPNGWTAPHDPPIAAYYPGSEAVDAVGFSAFNWGYCPRAATRRWDDPWAAYGPYLDTLRHIAPGKPLFIMQTATTAQTAQGMDAAAKDAWLVMAYQYLALQPDVWGVMYFNLDKECDWAVYLRGGRQSKGFRQALGGPAVDYRGPADWFQP